MPGAHLVLPPKLLAVQSLPEELRYQHFLRQAANSERVWGLLGARGWVTQTDLRGQFGLPVWPHPAYAAACAGEDWEACVPACIDVPVFLDRWLPDMAELGVLVDVFPVAGRRGHMVSAWQLELRLREQLALIAITSSMPANL